MLAAEMRLMLAHPSFASTSMTSVAPVLGWQTSNAVGGILSK